MQDGVSQVAGLTEALGGGSRLRVSGLTGGPALSRGEVTTRGLSSLQLWKGHGPHNPVPGGGHSSEMAGRPWDLLSGW